MSPSPRAPDPADGPAAPRSVWAFPRRRPQLHAASPAALAAATRYYAFGRPRADWQRTLVEALAGVPLARRFVVGRARFAPPCGWERWPRLVAAAAVTTAVDWVFFVPAWRRDRFGAFPIEPDGKIGSFVRAQRSGVADPHPVSTGVLRVPAVRRTADVEGWSVRVMEPLPPRLRAPRLDAARLDAVTAAIEGCLAGLPADADHPSDWRPMHGDLTPWNLREDRTGELWLLDWEAAGWGPPGADALHYRLAEASLVADDPRELAHRAATALGGVDPAAARFWLNHEVFAGPAPDPEGSAGRRADVARREAVVTALGLLAAP